MENKRERTLALVGRTILTVKRQIVSAVVQLVRTRQFVTFATANMGKQNLTIGAKQRILGRTPFAKRKEFATTTNLISKAKR